MKKTPYPGFEAAEAIGLAALGFLAGDAARIERFLALTGLSIAQLRTEAGTPRMLAAILDHLRGNESDLMAFAANGGLDPGAIGPAASVLRGTIPEHS